MQPVVFKPGDVCTIEGYYQCECQPRIYQKFKVGAVFPPCICQEDGEPNWILYKADELFETWGDPTSPSSN